MDEQTTATVPPAPAAVTSLTTRIVNTFSAPSELYTEVAAAPVQATSWVVPFILSIMLAILAVFVVFNNSSLRQQVMDVQQEAMKQKVAEGKMSQDQADKASEMMESGSTLFLIIGCASAGVGMVLIFFGGALVLWLAAKVALKFTGPYSKIMEVFGLTWFIGVIGTVITLFMMSYFGSLYAIPAPSALLTSMGTMGFAHKFLAALNIFTIWQVLVLGIGLSRVSGKSTGAGIGVSCGLWLVFVLITAALGWGNG